MAPRIVVVVVVVVVVVLVVSRPRTSRAPHLALVVVVFVVVAITRDIIVVLSPPFITSSSSSCAGDVTPRSGFDPSLRRRESVGLAESSECVGRLVGCVWVSSERWVLRTTHGDCMTHEEDIVEFTTHGRLAHERGEVEVFRVADDARTEAMVVVVRGTDAEDDEDDDGRRRLEVSMMVCTSARVVLVLASTAMTPRRAIGLRYSAITRVERMKKKHALSRTRRVRVATGTTEYEFRIKGSDGDTFARVVEEQVRKYEDGVRRAAAAEEAKAQATVEASAATAGIGGVFNRQRERVEETNRTLDEAFSDLSALMSKARELVILAERLAESSGTNKAENSELQRLVLSLGITSPVTRATSGASFHH